VTARIHSRHQVGGDGGRFIGIIYVGEVCVYVRCTKRESVEVNRIHQHRKVRVATGHDRVKRSYDQ